MACDAVHELIKACPAEDRTSIRALTSR